MMTLNYNEKDFQKKLQKDIEMPEIVHEHINQAYRLFYRKKHQRIHIIG